jgi:hypothetical protein
MTTPTCRHNGVSRKLPPHPGRKLDDGARQVSWLPGRGLRSPSQGLKPQWFIGRSLAGYSCGGSRGFTPRSLLHPLTGTLRVPNPAEYSRDAPVRERVSRPDTAHRNACRHAPMTPRRPRRGFRIATRVTAKMISRSSGSSNCSGEAAMILAIKGQREDYTVQWVQRAAPSAAPLHSIPRGGYRDFMRSRPSRSVQRFQANRPPIRAASGSRVFRWADQTDPVGGAAEPTFATGCSGATPATIAS